MEIDSPEPTEYFPLDEGFIEMPKTVPPQNNFGEKTSPTVTPKR